MQNNNQDMQNNNTYYDQDQFFPSDGFIEYQDMQNNNQDMQNNNTYYYDQDQFFPLDGFNGYNNYPPTYSFNEYNNYPPTYSFNEYNNYPPTHSFNNENQLPNIHALFSYNQHQQYDLDNLEVLPKAYKFEPSQEQLIRDYLIPKNQNTMNPAYEELIPEAQVYTQSPQDLVQGRALQNPSAQEWYFMSKRHPKYPRGRRPKRQAGDGYWKLSGRESIIKVNDIQVGVKTVLDYLTGNHPTGKKTFWKMHEYILQGENTKPKIDDWVICKIYFNEQGSKRKNGDVARDEPQNNFPDNNMEIGQQYVHEISNQTSVQEAPLPGAMDELWFYGHHGDSANQSNSNGSQSESRRRFDESE